MVSLTLIAIPTFLDTTTQPAQLYAQWARMYHYGHQALPGLAIMTLLLYLFAASRRRAVGLSWGIYVVAGAVTVSMLPFTWLFMVPTNDALFALELETKASPAASSLDEARMLLITWGQLHLARALFPLAGSIVGMTAMLNGRS